MRKMKKLKIQTVIGHARKHLEDGDKIGAIESVRTDTDYSPTEAKTLVEFIELFTIVETNATVASHWCEEHRIGRFRCVSQHPKLRTDLQSFIEAAGTNRDYAAEAKPLAEFRGSVGSFCKEQLAQRLESARLQQEIEPQSQQLKSTETLPRSPLSVPKCACGSANCDNQWHRLAMWIKDNPFEWQRVLEELTSTTSENVMSANAQDENLPD